MDRKNDATVEVVEVGNEYKVTCRFSPKTKFRDAINARFNDAKGDALCKKGIARYLNASPTDVISISGLHAIAPVKRVDGKLCYSFGVPIAGCKVMAASVSPKPGNELALPAAVSPGAVETVPGQSVGDRGMAGLEQKRKDAYVCVTKYREVEGRRTVVSQREYRRCNFNTSAEFERFCQSEFARIRASGDSNLRAVRNRGGLLSGKHPGK